MALSQADRGPTARPPYSPAGQKYSHRTSASDKSLWDHEKVRLNKKHLKILSKHGQKSRLPCDLQNTKHPLSWLLSDRYFPSRSSFSLSPVSPPREDVLRCQRISPPSNNTQSKAKPLFLTPLPQLPNTNANPIRSPYEYSDTPPRVHSPSLHEQVQLVQLQLWPQGPLPEGNDRAQSAGYS